ncbi:MAG: hypothetical protein ACPL06_01820 [Candidatus Anstonellales archaeon]
MKKIENIPFVVLKGVECDREKKTFMYLKTPVKGLYYIPSETERKSKTLLFGRFIPAFLDALKKQRGINLYYGMVTSAWNFGLTWRPVKFLEMFNNKKTFEVDFAKFAERYENLRSYYSKSLAKFYASLFLKRIIFRKVKSISKKCMVYDDRYLPGFYIKKECVLKHIKKYIPKHTKKLFVLKKEYYSILADIKTKRI